MAALLRLPCLYNVSPDCSVPTPLLVDLRNYSTQIRFYFTVSAVDGIPGAGDPPLEVGLEPSTYFRGWDCLTFCATQEPLRSH